MFKKSFLLCGLISSFCVLQAKGLPPEIESALQEGVARGIDASVAEALTKSPYSSDNERERLLHLRGIVEELKRKHEETIKGSSLEVFENSDEKKVVVGAALASLAATYINRFRALRISGFIIPLLVAYCMVSAKFLYYAVKCAINECDGRISKIDWQLKNCRK